MPIFFPPLPRAEPFRSAAHLSAILFAALRDVTISI
jgi:hypothetical protein